jgi:hypothetical protein
MQVNARISKEWRQRILFMFFMIFGLAAWFLTDGYIFWPKENQRYTEFAQIAEPLIEEGRAEDRESPAVQLAWQRHCREEGYNNTKIPKERTDSDIAQQLWIGWIKMAGVFLFGIWICWNHTRSIRAEGELITGASGEQVPLDAIIETDRRKWAKKGIAYAIYEVQGKRRRLTLDDHKFAGCEAILLEAEKRIEARAAASKQSKAPAEI